MAFVNKQNGMLSSEAQHPWKLRYRLQTRVRTSDSEPRSEFSWWSGPYLRMLATNNLSSVRIPHPPTGRYFSILPDSESSPSEIKMFCSVSLVQLKIINHCVSLEYIKQNAKQVSTYGHSPIEWKALSSKMLVKRLNNRIVVLSNCSDRLWTVEDRDKSGILLVPKTVHSFRDL